jgi:dienelactone hydrolase
MDAFALAVVALIGAPQDAARVFDPPRVPEDARLGPLHHVDNPWSFAPAFTDRQAWEKRAAELRVQVRVATGLWPALEAPPLAPVIHGAIDRGDYTVEKVFFASLPGHYVSGNLYRPKGAGGRRPAVLSPHGHWANGRFYERGEKEAKKEIELGAEKTMEGARYPLQARCAMLARLGCVVFHYDMTGYADSKTPGHTRGFSDVEAELRLQNFMGLQTWNSIRALDFLAALPDVDPARIAVTGASGGGTQTFILCAVDERPAVSFPAVMVSTAMQGGCICENASFLRVGTNNIELAALFAPKPQGMTGANDWTVEIEKKGLPELKRIYGLYGAADNVMAKYASFEHNYNQDSRELMYAWVNKHLKLGHAEPIEEKPFEPIPPAQLSVYGEEHPRPEDAGDADVVRRFMTEASDRRMAALAKDPVEYRRVVGAALRAMTQARAPEAVESDEALTKVQEGDAYVLYKGLLKARPDGGARIPALGLVPRGFEGTVVIWVHPDGKAGLFGADGKPAAAVRRLLERKVAVASADLFLTGEFHLPDKPTPSPFLDQKYHQNVPFAGYMFGYNLPTIAHRVQDLLTLVSLADGTQNVKSIHLVGVGRAGPWALLARALAGDAIDRAAIDLGGFDFDQVKDLRDENMLPGALKYGGILGFVPLIANGQTALYNAPKSPSRERVKLATGVALKDGAPEPEAIVDWLLSR